MASRRPQTAGVTLDPRRTTTFEAARRRSRFMRRLRATLIVGMLVIVGANAAFATRHAISGAGREQIAEPMGVVEMINPRYSGRDSAGNPYVITANTAIRDPERPGQTELVRPRLEFRDKNGPGSIVDADIGLYDRGAGALDLDGSVQLETENGYSFSTSIARVYPEEGRVVGDAPIRGQGPMGAIEASAFEILDQGKRVVFRGSVIGRIEQDPRLAPDLREVDAPEPPVELETDGGAEGDE